MRLDRVDARSKVKPRRDPHWARLARGRSVGFRKMTPGSEGTWLARFYDETTRKYTQQPLGEFTELEAKDRFDAARRAAEEWFQHLEQGGAAKPGTLWAACEAYIDDVRTEKGERAANDTRNRLTKWVKGDPIARVDLAKLAPQHVKSWRTRTLDAIRKDGGSDASFNRHATSLRAALNLARRQRRVPTDQAWKEDLKPIEGAGSPRTLYLNLQRRRSLVEAASESSRPFFTALALLPMRAGELAALQAQHLDVEQRMLRVPKNKTQARDVPLSAEALEHFSACARDKLPQAWLIARPDGSQWKKEAWRDEIKDAAARAKLPSATVAGTLRHSTITDLVVAGLDLFTVAKLAGTSVAMVEATYGKLQSDHARNALQGLSLKVI